MLPIARFAMLGIWVFALCTGKVAIGTQACERLHALVALSFLPNHEHTLLCA